MKRSELIQAAEISRPTFDALSRNSHLPFPLRSAGKYQNDDLQKLRLLLSLSRCGMQFAAAKRLILASEKDASLVLKILEGAHVIHA